MQCVHLKLKQNCSACDPSSVYKAYQRSAIRRNLQFTLTLDDFIRITSGNCVFCNDRNEPHGIDRRNNSIGYVLSPLGQCQSSCTFCNLDKGDWDQEVWLQGITKIVRYQDSLKEAKKVLAAQPATQPPIEQPQPDPVVEPEPTFPDHHPGLSAEAVSYLAGSRRRPNCF